MALSMFIQGDNPHVLIILKRASVYLQLKLFDIIILYHISLGFDAVFQSVQESGLIHGN